jgi:hypothetical protein
MAPPFGWVGIVRALSPERAEREQRALGAPGTAGAAQFPAKPDQVEVELELLPPRDEWGEGIVGVASPGRESQPRGDPGDVGVHREERATEPEQKDDVGRLLPHPGEGQEPGRGLSVRKPGEEVEVQGPSLIAEPGEDRVEALGPLVVEARPRDRSGDVTLGGSEDVLPGREPTAELGVGAVPVAVRRVLGKNRSHQEIERGLGVFVPHGAEPAPKPSGHLGQLGAGIHDREG